jgi:vacuolar-type H+-ATPase subunit H
LEQFLVEEAVLLSVDREQEVAAAKAAEERRLEEAREQARKEARERLEMARARGELA